MRRDTQVILLLSLTVTGYVAAMPKIETADGKSSAQPGKGEYFSDDQTPLDSQIGSTELPLQDRPPRFGFPTYTTDALGNSQSGVVPGVYGPVKLDIGGLLLGTIVGLGAFFILPKLFHFGTPYGPYKRSEDETSQGGVALSEIFTNVQETLNSYNVNSTACLQRAICYSVQSASEKASNATSTIDNWVDNVTKNDLTKSLIDGTEWKKAVDVGESGGDCDSTFSQCPVSLGSVASAIAKYLIS